MPYGTVNADLITGSTGGTMSPASTFGFKSRIINGSMVIDQRNAGASVTATGSNYCLDRWQMLASVTSKFTVQQNAGSVTPPVGFSNYLGVTSSAATSLGATDYYLITQKIEGFNTSDLAWGTANGKTITVSFQVYSSLTGTFGFVLRNSAGSSVYPASYTISTANTWTSVSVTVSAPPNGTTWIGATNGIGIELDFGLGVGSTYSNTAGTWTTGGLGVTGATSVVGTNGATFYITGVQLEVGTNATSFDYRPYGTELALCQRYYEMYPSMAYRNSNGTILTGGAIFGNMVNTLVGFSGSTGTQASISTSFKVEKRATPTVTLSTRSTSYTNQVETRGGSGVYSNLDKTTSGISVIANQVAGGADCYIGYGYEASAEL